MPRPKPVLRLFFGLWGWGAALAALLAAAGFLMLWEAGEKASRLKEEGETASARITSLAEKPYRPGNRPPTDRYRVFYDFTVGSATQLGEQVVSGDFFRAHSVGDRVPVRYWPGDPGLSEIEPELARTTSLAGGVIGLLATAVAIMLGRIAWRNASEALWLARLGQRHSVEILDHVQSDGLPLWRATWRRPDGRTGASARRMKSALPSVGQRVMILIDPEDHRPSRLEADVCRAQR